MNAVALPTLNRSRSRTDLVQLIQTADRGDIRRERSRLGPLYFINDRPRPDALTAIAQLIRDGLLHDTKPKAKTSTIRPTKDGLAKIGAHR